ncbi:4'-phosphopantetheinyl transferase [Tabrizicola sp.]|jgi:4'-phosphopantetheinyl transferase EntD|uniref:4'-phosphopantetheinyl transferase family protein n=1 Tax=Tabrizicola sp. TaxID=2005166 RepID=UPI0025D07107|nr:4'-phosphopantetheinyl transferase superfamily protein [Tabrizicola sp.]MBY0350380.1 4'-phosphopantetheinyl transferase superfamily protein [Tabrizicola sp.]
MTQPSRLKRIEAALAAMFPADVALALCSLAAADARDLWPAERPAIAGAVPLRLAEFAAGRQAARAALAALGQEPVALPMGPDRAPLWPPGIAGSISHTAGLAAAVARRGAPLGLDIEDDAPLPSDLWPVIAGEDERAALPRGETGRGIRQIFAAKEALFKAQAQGHRAMFGFDAVAVALANGGFSATFRISAGAFRSGQIIHGRMALSEGLILAGVAR